MADPIQRTFVQDPGALSGLATGTAIGNLNRSKSDVYGVAAKLSGLQSVTDDHLALAAAEAAQTHTELSPDQQLMLGTDYYNKSRDQHRRELAAYETALGQMIDEHAGRGYEDVFGTPEQQAAIKSGSSYKRTEEQAKLLLAQQAPVNRRAQILTDQRTPEEEAALQKMLGEDVHGRSGETRGLLGKVAYGIGTTGRMAAGAAAGFNEALTAGLPKAPVSEANAVPSEPPTALDAATGKVLTQIGQGAAQQGVTPLQKGIGKLVGGLAGQLGSWFSEPNIPKGKGTGPILYNQVPVTEIAKHPENLVRALGVPLWPNQEPSGAVAGAAKAFAGEEDDANSVAGKQSAIKQGIWQQAEKLAREQYVLQPDQPLTPEAQKRAQAIYNGAIQSDIMGPAIESPNAAQFIAGTALDPMTYAGGEIASGIAKGVGAASRAGVRVATAVAPDAVAAVRRGVTGLSDVFDAFKEASAVGRGTGPKAEEAADAMRVQERWAGSKVDEQLLPGLQKIKELESIVPTRERATFTQMLQGEIPWPENPPPWMQVARQLNKDIGDISAAVHQEHGVGQWLESVPARQELGAAMREIKDALQQPGVDATAARAQYRGLIQALKSKDPSALDPEIVPLYERLQKLNAARTAETDVGDAIVRPFRRIAGRNELTGLPQDYVPRLESESEKALLRLGEEPTRGGAFDWTPASAKARTSVEDLTSMDLIDRWKKHYGSLSNAAKKSAETRGLMSRLEEVGVAAQTKLDPAAEAIAKRKIAEQYRLANREIPAAGEQIDTLMARQSLADQTIQRQERALDQFGAKATKVMYHGGPAKITAVDPSRARPTGQQGPGFYMAHKSLAKRFGPEVSEFSAVPGAKTLEATGFGPVDPNVFRKGPMPLPGGTYSVRQYQKLYESGGLAAHNKRNEQLFRDVAAWAQEKGNVELADKLRSQIPINLDEWGAALNQYARENGYDLIHVYDPTFLKSTDLENDFGDVTVALNPRAVMPPRKSTAAPVARHEALATRNRAVAKYAELGAEIEGAKKTQAALATRFQQNMPDIEKSLADVSHNQAKTAEWAAKVEAASKAAGVPMRTLGDVQDAGQAARTVWRSTLRQTLKPGERLAGRQMVLPEPVVQRLRDLLVIQGDKASRASTAASVNKFMIQIMKTPNSLIRAGVTLLGGAVKTGNDLVTALGLGGVAHGIKFLNPELQRTSIAAAMASAALGDVKAGQIAMRLPSGEILTAAEAIDHLKRFGLIDQHGMRMALDLSGKTPAGAGIEWLAKHVGPLYNISPSGKLGTENATRFLDNYQKLSIYMGFLNGKDTASIEKALNLTSKFAGDYKRISEAEAGIRDYFMFYSWNRFVLPHLLSQVVRNPQRFQPWVRARLAMHQSSTQNAPYPELPIPEYLQGRAFGAPAMWKNPQGWSLDEAHQFAVSAMDDPWGVLSGTLTPLVQGKPGSFASGMVSPMAKLAMEMVTGRDAETGEALAAPVPWDPDLFVGDLRLDKILGAARANVLVKTLLAPVARPYGALSNGIKLYTQAGRPLESLDLSMRYKASRDFAIMALIMDKIVGQEMSLGSHIPGFITYPVSGTRTAAKRATDATAAKKTTLYQMEKP